MRNGYWLNKPRYGLKRAVFYIILFLSISPFFKWFSTVIVLAYLSYLIINLLRYGYFHRIASFTEYGSVIEIVDYKIPFKPQVGERRIRIKDQDVTYGKVYTDKKINNKKLLYLPIVSEAYELFFKDRSRNTLFLGGGIMANPIFFRVKETNNVDVVEKSTKFISLSEKYFAPLFEKGILKRINIIHDDAYHFVKNNVKKYDYIFQDIFVNNLVPDIFLSENWFLGLLEISQKNGVIFVNLGPFDPKKSVSFIFNTLKFNTQKYFKSFLIYNGLLMLLVYRVKLNSKQKEFISKYKIET